MSPSQCFSSSTASRCRRTLYNTIIVKSCRFSAPLRRRGVVGGGGKRITNQSSFRLFRGAFLQYTDNKADKKNFLIATAALCNGGGRHCSTSQPAPPNTKSTNTNILNDEEEIRKELVKNDDNHRRPTVYTDSPRNATNLNQKIIEDKEGTYDDDDSRRISPLNYSTSRSRRGGGRGGRHATARKTPIFYLGNGLAARPLDDDWGDPVTGRAAQNINSSFSESPLEERLVQDAGVEARNGSSLKEPGPPVAAVKEEEGSDEETSLSAIPQEEEGGEKKGKAVLGGDTAQMRFISLLGPVVDALGEFLSAANPQKGGGGGKIGDAAAASKLLIAEARRDLMNDLRCSLTLTPCKETQKQTAGGPLSLQRLAQEEVEEDFNHLYHYTLPALHRYLCRCLNEIKKEEKKGEEEVRVLLAAGLPPPAAEVVHDIVRSSEAVLSHLEDAHRTQARWFTPLFPSSLVAMLVLVVMPWWGCDGVGGPRSDKFRRWGRLVSERLALIYRDLAPPTLAAVLRVLQVHHVLSDDIIGPICKSLLDPVYWQRHLLQVERGAALLPSSPPHARVSGAVGRPLVRFGYLSLSPVETAVTTDSPTSALPCDSNGHTVMMSGEEALEWAALLGRQSAPGHFHIHKIFHLVILPALTPYLERLLARSDDENEGVSGAIVGTQTKTHDLRRASPPPPTPMDSMCSWDVLRDVLRCYVRYAAAGERQVGVLLALVIRRLPSLPLTALIDLLHVLTPSARAAYTPLPRQRQLSAEGVLPHQGQGGQVQHPKDEVAAMFYEPLLEAACQATAQLLSLYTSAVVLRRPESPTSGGTAVKREKKEEEEKQEGDVNPSSSSASSSGVLTFQSLASALARTEEKGEEAEAGVGAGLLVALPHWTVLLDALLAVLRVGRYVAPCDRLSWETAYQSSATLLLYVLGPHLSRRADSSKRRAAITTTTTTAESMKNHSWGPQQGTRLLRVLLSTAGSLRGRPHPTSGSAAFGFAASFDDLFLPPYHPLFPLVLRTALCDVVEALSSPHKKKDEQEVLREELEDGAAMASTLLLAAHKMQQWWPQQWSAASLPPPVGDESSHISKNNNNNNNNLYPHHNTNTSTKTSATTTMKEVLFGEDVEHTVHREQPRKQSHQSCVMDGNNCKNNLLVVGGDADDEGCLSEPLLHSMLVKLFRHFGSRLQPRAFMAGLETLSSSSSSVVAAVGVVEEGYKTNVASTGSPSPDVAGVSALHHLPVRSQTRIIAHLTRIATAVPPRTLVRGINGILQPFVRGVEEMRTAWEEWTLIHVKFPLSRSPSQDQGLSSSSSSSASRQVTMLQKRERALCDAMSVMVDPVSIQRWLSRFTAVDVVKQLSVKNCAEMLFAIGTLSSFTLHLPPSAVASTDGKNSQAEAEDNVENGDYPMRLVKPLEALRRDNSIAIHALVRRATQVVQRVMSASSEDVGLDFTNEEMDSMRRAQLIRLLRDIPLLVRGVNLVDAHYPHLLSRLCRLVYIATIETQRQDTASPHRRTSSLDAEGEGGMGMMAAPLVPLSALLRPFKAVAEEWLLRRSARGEDHHRLQKGDGTLFRDAWEALRERIIAMQWEDGTEEAGEAAKHMTAAVVWGMGMGVAESDDSGVHISQEEKEKGSGGGGDFVLVQFSKTTGNSNHNNMCRSPPHRLSFFTYQALVVVVEAWNSLVLLDPTDRPLFQVLVYRLGELLSRHAHSTLTPSPSPSLAAEEMGDTDAVTTSTPAPPSGTDGVQRLVEDVLLSLDPNAHAVLLRMLLHKSLQTTPDTPASSSHDHNDVVLSLLLPLALRLFHHSPRRRHHHHHDHEEDDYYRLRLYKVRPLEIVLLMTACLEVFSIMSSPSISSSSSFWNSASSVDVHSLHVAYDVSRTAFLRFYDMNDDTQKSEKSEKGNTISSPSPMASSAEKKDVENEKEDNRPVFSITTPNSSPVVGKEHFARLIIALANAGLEDEELVHICCREFFTLPIQRAAATRRGPTFAFLSMELLVHLTLSVCFHFPPTPAGSSSSSSSSSSATLHRRRFLRPLLDALWSRTEELSLSHIQALRRCLASPTAGKGLPLSQCDESSPPSSSIAIDEDFLQRLADQEALLLRKQQDDEEVKETRRKRRTMEAEEEEKRKPEQEKEEEETAMPTQRPHAMNVSTTSSSSSGSGSGEVVLDDEEPNQMAVLGAAAVPSNNNNKVNNTQENNNNNHNSNDDDDSYCPSSSLSEEEEEGNAETETSSGELHVAAGRPVASTPSPSSPSSSSSSAVRLYGSSQTPDALFDILQE